MIPGPRLRWMGGLLVARQTWREAVQEQDTRSDVTVRCPFCLKMNRVDLGRAAARPTCGECSRPILLDRPFKVMEEDFDRSVLGSEAPVLVDFYADWCVSCLEMEAYTFTDSDVQAALSNTIWLQADVTANDEVDQALLKSFGVFGPPTIIFFGTDGQQRNGYEVVGYMKAKDFANHVRMATGNSGTLSASNQ